YDACAALFLPLFKALVTLRLELNCSPCLPLQLLSSVRILSQFLPKKLSIVSLLMAWLSDRYYKRGLVTIATTSLCIIGFAMFLGNVQLDFRPELTLSYRLSKSPCSIWLSLLLHYGRLQRLADHLSLEC